MSDDDDGGNDDDDDDATFDAEFSDFGYKYGMWRKWSSTDPMEAECTICAEP